MKAFRDLKVWEKAHQVALAAYADFARFLQNAMGSASELEYRFLLAHDLGYLSVVDYPTLHAQVIEIKRLLAALIQTHKVNR